MIVDQLLDPRATYFTHYELAKLLEKANDVGFSLDQGSCLEAMTPCQLRDYLEGKYQA